MSDEQVKINQFGAKLETEDKNDTSMRFLPTDWEVRKLGSDFAIEYGQERPENEFVEEGYPVYGANGIIGYSDEKLFDDQVIAVTCRGATCGNIHLTEPNVWVTNNSLVLLNGGSVNKSYLAHALRYHSVERAISGSAQPQITASMLSKMEYPVPPIEEQRKIASVLYTVDQAIQKTEEIIDQIERVKQGVRQDILTRGIIDGNSLRSPPSKSPEAYEVTRNWTIPNDWELKQLSNVCTLQVGYAFKSDWYRDSGEVRVLRGANVGYGKPDWSDEKYLEPKRVEEYQEYRLNSGDIIIGMDRPFTSSGFKISRLSIGDVPSLLVQRVGRYHPESINQDYLHVILSDWRYQKQVLRRAQGMDIPHISKTDILSPKIPVPPRHEQVQIAEVFTNMRKRAESEEIYRIRLERLKQGLMQDLLSGEVRTPDKDIEVVDEVLAHG